MNEKVEADIKRLNEAKQSAELRLKVMDARSQMLDFLELMHPDPNPKIDNPLATQFQRTPLARMLCDIVEKANSGESKRICVSVGPQFGKSEVLSRAAPAWLSGNDPSRHMILGAYNDSFASEFGGDVRSMMQSQRYKDVFPDHALKRGSEAKDLLQTTKGGKMAFVGVGGSGTGKRADFFFVDDPYKNDEDAQSEAYREKAWKWLNGVALSRCHKDSVIFIVHTRWHEDDLIGRLCDPNHPERNKRYKGIAERWDYYNLPAIITEQKLADTLNLELKKPTDPLVIEQFGDKPLVSLWEERKSSDFLAEAKQMDNRIFGALYMGEPSPESGTYFTSEYLQTYDTPLDLPERLEIYAASDHAVSEKQKADYTVLGCVGVDENDNIWVLPDIVWERMETDKTVEEMLGMMSRRKPLWWLMEEELISKSFGPFLKTRMHEERVYTTLLSRRPTKDKRTRARAIQGRMSTGKVFFPSFAPWWPQAKQQLLRFPYGAHDDFVDWLSWIGLGLLMEHGSNALPKNDKVIKVGTIDWVKASSNAQARKKVIEKARKGW